MVFLLFCVVTLFFLASLLPVLFPGSLIGLLGGFLNVLVGEALDPILPDRIGWMVEVTRQGHQLTTEGVLAVYLPVLTVLYLVMRKGR